MSNIVNASQPAPPHYSSRAAQFGPPAADKSKRGKTLHLTAARFHGRVAKAHGRWLATSAKFTSGVEGCE
jgi:hypothetical protein